MRVWPADKPLGVRVWPADKPLGVRVWPADKPLGVRVWPADKPLGVRVWPADKPLGVRVWPADKPLGVRVGPADKPLGVRVWPADKPLGVRVWPADKPLGVRVWPADKPLGVRVWPADKPLGVRVWPADKPLGVRVWPADKPLGVRVSATDWVAGGWTPEETVVLARELGGLGCDFVDVSSGGMDPGQQIPLGPGYQVPLAAKVRAEAGIATMAVGMITEPQQAENIVASGRADMVALARGMMYDPRWAWHAAEALGAETTYAPGYARCHPARWPEVFRAGAPPNSGNSGQAAAAPPTGRAG